MIELDGAQGEGGGQILRSSLALALLTERPFRLRNIRANRAKPGLQPQHLMSVRAAARIGGATVRGDAIGSHELTFVPGPVQAGQYRFPIGTAGATGLVLQAIYLPLALRARETTQVTLEGGTHVKASPNFHFLQVTWRAYLERLGLRVELEMICPGFYPRGGGEIHATVHPCAAVRRAEWRTRTTPNRIDGFSAVAGLPAHIAERQARRAESRLHSRGLKVDIRRETWSGGPGSVLALEVIGGPAPTLFCALGARGKPAESVADDAVDETLAFLETAAPVDPHSADQIVLPMSFAEGSSEFRVSTVTRHLRTNIAVIQSFLPRQITCTGVEGESGMVRIAAREV